MVTPLTVGQVLKAKGFDFWFINPDATAYEALELMAEKNIGALPVMEGGKLVGMFSERDYARKVILKGKSSKTTTVRDLMSGNPIQVTPGQSIIECMVIMTNNHIRHLPVADRETIIGILSIGDVVGSIISDQQSTIRDLESYIGVGY